MNNRLLLIFSLIICLIISCKQKEYARAYVKIVSPSNNSIVKSGDTIHFKNEWKLSGVLFEFDYATFTLINKKTGDKLIEQAIKDTIQFIPDFKDTVNISAYATYWREDSTKPDKIHQINLTVIP